MASTKFKLSKCEKSVYKTLSYFAIFNYPVSLYRLATFLISDEPYTVSQLQSALKTLQQAKIVTEHKGLYSLKGGKKVDTVARCLLSLEALRQAGAVSEVLSKIPWIKLLCVTGSCAAFNKEETGDIDVFIVSARNRVWLTRLFTVLVLKVLNIYRTDTSYVNKLCPNLIVAEDAMSWEHDKNVFVAHEICAMHPVLDRENTYFKFLSQNLWVRSYFPNFMFSPVAAEGESKPAFLLDYVETALMKLQLLYMKRHLTKEVVTKSFIHFNKTDTKEFVLSKFLAS